MKKLFCWELAGGIFVLIFGSLLHFVYGWTGDNPVVGALAPVNESTWEHLKLLIVPMILFTIVEYFAVGRKFSGFLPAKAMALALGMLAIVTIFYTYAGIVGRNFLWADILTFAVAVVLSYRYSWRAVVRKPEASRKRQIAALCVLGGILLVTVLFTYVTPEIGLFQDPVTGLYGIQ